jgi:hypothetical protein
MSTFEARDAGASAVDGSVDVQPPEDSESVYSGGSQSHQPAGAAALPAAVPSGSGLGRAGLSSLPIGASACTLASQVTYACCIYNYNTSDEVGWGVFTKQTEIVLL